MKIVYKFETDHEGVPNVVTIDVDEEYGNVILASRREEHANNERHRRHNYSLSQAVEEGIQYADPSDIDSICSREEFQAKFYEIFDTLTPTQQRRVNMLGDGMSLREIARREGVNLSKVQKTMEQVQKKFAEMHDMM